VRANAASAVGFASTMERRPNTQTLQWFLENAASQQLVLDPPFQRRTVWSVAYRRYFIDTILRNYPSPAVFLEWEVEPGSPTVYNVVDGKQRLSAIIDFTRDKFHLAELWVEGGKSNVYWSDLDSETKKEFVNYVFTVENINDASDEERREAFDRLNRNVARLAAQELRHAQFAGVFLERMEALAADPFWLNKRIVTPANVRRMRDVEFVAELFILTADGIVDGDADIIDSYFADWDEDIPDEDVVRDRFDRIQTYLGNMPIKWATTRWKNMNDLYGLWAALLALEEDGELPEPKLAARRLTRFSKTQEAILAADRAGDKLPGTDADRRYFGVVRQGGNKEANRRARLEILMKLLRH
jgi:hypothetical protein